MVRFPRPDAAMSGSRTQTIEAGLPEMAGKRDFYLRIAADLYTDEMLKANLSGMVSSHALLDPLTTSFAQQFVRFISDPGEAAA